MKELFKEEGLFYDVICYEELPSGGIIFDRKSTNKLWEIIKNKCEDLRSGDDIHDGILFFKEKQII